MTNVTYVRYSALASALRAAKDLLFVVHPKGKFALNRGTTVSTENPTLTSIAYRDVIVDSETTLSLTGQKQMSRDETRKLKPSHRNLLLITALGLHCPDEDLSMPIIEIGALQPAALIGAEGFTPP